MRDRAAIEQVKQLTAPAANQLALAIRETATPAVNASTKPILSSDRNSAGLRARSCLRRSRIGVTCAPSTLLKTDVDRIAHFFVEGAAVTQASLRKSDLTFSEPQAGAASACAVAAQISIATIGSTKAPLRVNMSASHPTIAGPARIAR